MKNVRAGVITPRAMRGLAAACGVASVAQAVLVKAVARAMPCGEPDLAVAWECVDSAVVGPKAVACEYRDSAVARVHVFQALAWQCLSAIG